MNEISEKLEKIYHKIGELDVEIKKYDGTGYEKVLKKEQKGLELQAITLERAYRILLGFKNWK